MSLAAKLRAQPIAVQRALKDAHINPLDVDGIAFTRGPGKCFSVFTGQCVSLETSLKAYNIGMTGCLGVGCSAAKTLAAALNKPLVGVHHMVYHLSLMFDP